MRTPRLVVTAVLVVAAGLAFWIALGPPSSRAVPKATTTTARARVVTNTPRPTRSTVNAPVRILPASPPSARLRMRYVTTIGGHISPKSVDASGTGLVFAQNMIYTHTVTVYDDRDYRLVATIPDAVTLRNWGYTQYPGRYLGGPVEAAFSPDRRYVYVSNYSMYGPALTRQGHDVCSPADDYDSSFVYRISVATMRIDQVIHVGSVPKFVAVTPDGRHLEKVKVTIKRILNESVRCRASSSCLSSRGESGTGPPGCLHVVNGGVPGAGRVRVPGGSHGPWCRHAAESWRVAAGDRPASVRGWRGRGLAAKGRVRMSRVVVIGATGHIGTYLVPRLVDGGHEVIAVSRGTRGPYRASPQWEAVTRVTADREAEDAAGTFGARMAALRPEAVIDLICFTPASARQLVEALRPSRPLLVHCGTIWVHGPALRVPVTEDEPRTAYGEYGTGKAGIEALLNRESRAGGIPTVVLHPGHISGPGWPVITPAGNLDPAAWTALATGRPLALPDHGLGVLHHVHADDVAQAFEFALSRPAAIGGSFHVAAEQAMTQRGLAAGVARWFGREPALEFVGWDEFTRRVGSGPAEVTREHTFRGITASIARAREVLGYAPRYTSLEALHEALAWLVADGQADVGGQPLPGR